MKYVKKFPTRELSFHPFTNDFLFVSKTKKKVVITLKNGESLALLMIQANLHLETRV